MNPYNYCAGNPVMLVDEDGRKIITYSRGENNEAIEYHFVTGEDGKGAFFDNNGNEYNKNEQFIIDLTDALNVLNEGKEGRSLVSNLENIEQNITILSSKNSNSQARYVVRWNPQNRFLSESTDISGNKERPSYIGLAHEMAHVQDYLNGTFSDNVWYINAAGNKIITAEQYATFIENKIRDEHRIPLRAFYNDKDDPESSLIIFGANGKITARYYNHTFKQVKEYGKVKF